MPPELQLSLQLYVSQAAALLEDDLVERLAASAVLDALGGAGRARPVRLRAWVVPSVAAEAAEAVAAAQQLLLLMQQQAEAAEQQSSSSSTLCGGELAQAC